MRKLSNYINNIESLGFKMGNNKDCGRLIFNPIDMIKLFIYGYFHGIRSCWKLANQAIINRELAWLINGLQPKNRVIAEFRKDNIMKKKVQQRINEYLHDLSKNDISEDKN